MMDVLGTWGMLGCLTFGIWLYYTLHEEFVFFFVLGNWKYALLKKISGFVYMEDISVEETLRLDQETSKEILDKRAKGFEQLKEKMKVYTTKADGKRSESPTKGEMSEEQKENSSVDVASSASSGIVDCRFLKWKVMNPLLRSLRIPYPNVVTERRGTKVVVPNGEEMTYVSGDAVHFFDGKFYEEIRSETERLCKCGETTKTMDASSKIVSGDPRTPITLTPEIIDHAHKIARVTGMERVRYSLSGSEAVEMAFRIARVATGKNIIVRFDKAYHGHTAGSTIGGKNFVYLPAMDESAIKHYIEAYHHRIAGVVVNPMDHFTGPNALSPPGEKITWGRRRRDIPTREAYASWLRCISETCAYVTKYLTPVAFIVDDVYFSFRTPDVHSLRYFGASKSENVRADMIIMGKGIGGGAPLSLVAGTKAFMDCRDKNWLLKVNKIVGTMTSWREGVVRSTVFLDKYMKNLDRVAQFVTRCDDFSRRTNDAMEKENIGIRVRNFSNTFTVDYLSTSIFLSLFPVYLMAEGVWMSNQSTGKFNLSEDWDAQSMSELSESFVRAARKMRDDGFLHGDKRNVNTWKLLQRFVRSYVGVRYRQIMLDKHIDISVSHNHPVNRFVHFWSSVLMLAVSYPLFFMSESMTGAVLSMLSFQMLRQIGHFFYERTDPHIEKRKFGHKDHSKKCAAVFIFASIVLQLIYSPFRFMDQLTVTLGLAFTSHAAEIWYQYGAIRAMDWWIKIITDPATDVMDFFDSAFIPLSQFQDIHWNAFGNGKVRASLQPIERALSPKKQKAL